MVPTPKGTALWLNLLLPLLYTPQPSLCFLYFIQDCKKEIYIKTSNQKEREIERKKEGEIMKPHKVRGICTDVADCIPADMIMDLSNLNKREERDVYERMGMKRAAQKGNVVLSMQPNDPEESNNRKYIYIYTKHLERKNEKEMKDVSVVVGFRKLVDHLRRHMKEERNADLLPQQALWSFSQTTFPASVLFDFLPSLHLYFCFVCFSFRYKLYTCGEKFINISVVGFFQTNLSPN
eukprot:gene1541-926_t